MLAVLLEREGNRMAAYLIGPCKESILKTWRENGIRILAATEIEDPFPGITREFVYYATRPEDERDFRS